MATTAGLRPAELLSKNVGSPGSTRTYAELTQEAYEFVLRMVESLAVDTTQRITSGQLVVEPANATAEEFAEHLFREHRSFTPIIRIGF